MFAVSSPKNSSSSIATLLVSPRCRRSAPALFRAGGAAFLVDGHSEVKGKVKEPQRILLSFSVSDVAAEQERLQAQGVEFVRVANEGSRGVASSPRSWTSTGTTASL